MGEEKGGVAVEEEGMQCSKHPYKSNANPGGICAFCLQEKLGKLVSSSNSTSPFFPLHPPPSSNNSSPPSFRSIDTIQPNNKTTNTSSSSYSSHVKSHRSRSSRISSFLSTSSSHYHHQQQQHRKKLQPPKSTSSSSSAAVAAAPSALSLKRTKSVAPKPVSDNLVNPASITMDSPRKKSFWSFLYLSSSSTSTGTNASPHTTTATNGTSTASAAAMRRRSVSSFSSSRAHGPIGSIEEEGVAKRDAHLGAVIGDDESPSPGGSQSHASSSSFGRKVARSRSVGCGSRSFSGDFLERLSNGFGDCTLRRVESQRESHSSKSNKMVLPGQLEDDDEDCVEARRMRMRCSGFFGSSSSYWLATAPEGSARMSTGGVGRSNRGWGWAFASPMRAFRPPPTSSASLVKSMPASSHLKATNGICHISEPQPSTLATAEAAALPPPVSLS